MARESTSLIMRKALRARGMQERGKNPVNHGINKGNSRIATVRKRRERRMGTGETRLGNLWRRVPQRTWFVTRGRFVCRAFTCKIGGEWERIELDNLRDELRIA